MAADQNLGKWDARVVEPLPERNERREDTETSSPEVRSPEPQRPLSGREPGRRRGSTFWLGVLVGLLPLVALVAGLVGYRLAGGDDGAEATDASLDTNVGADIGSITPTNIEEPDVDPAPAAETEPASPSSTTGNIAAVPLVASGTVDGETLELGGVLPATTRARWTAEIGTLAAALGRRLVDGTEEAADADGTASAELIVGFPGAVVFQEQSPSFFDGDPDPIFVAVADALNQGTAQLTIVAYADPSDPEAALLALSRAEHVHEHLVALDVDPMRMIVEARPPQEAPTGGDTDGPVDRRSDLEFHYAS